MLVLSMQENTVYKCLMFFNIYRVIFQKLNFSVKNLLSLVWTKYFKWSLKGKKFCILLSLTDLSIIFSRLVQHAKWWVS